MSSSSSASSGGNRSKSKSSQNSKESKEASKDRDEGRVAVFVRCRPLQSKEILQQQFHAARTHHSHKCLGVETTANCSNPQKVVVLGTKKEFFFDRVFDEDTSQIDLFQSSVEPLLAGCFEGFNLTVLAYGQTGSGKTHTMGSSSGLLSTQEEGIIPRVLRHVFGYIESLDNEKNQSSAKVSESPLINLRLSFVEIYNEEIRDLLHPEVSSKDIGLREDAQGRIFFVGAREEAVFSIEQAFSFLDKGSISRTTGDTLMNATSSRSHAILTLNIEMVYSPESKNDSLAADSEDREVEVNSFVQSKISLVDLAGSERAKRTGASGSRLKESVGINQGLLSLGKVIRALTTATQTATSNFVPYRESKLTRYLQDSLGGNSRTIMFACVSQSNSDIHETLTTLQYASRARAVRNKVVANVMVGPSGNTPMLDDGVVEALRRQVNNLKEQLKQRDALSAMPEEKSQNVQLQVNCQSQEAKDVLVQKAHDAQTSIVNGINFFDEVLESGDVDLKQPRIADEWEECLAKMHQTLSVIEELRTTFVAAPLYSCGDSRGACSEECKASQLALENELMECKEDLKRDEEIFSDKVNELSRLRRQLRNKEKDNMSLQKEVYMLTEKLDELQQAAESQLQSDSLDVSVAVAATEPHVSQLMEDLELISKEKESLSSEKLRAEQLYSEAAKSAKLQKEEFDARKEEMQKELRHLEIGIKMKEECIRTITKEKKDIVTKADLYETRVRELEEEKGRLISKLSHSPSKTESKTNESKSDDNSPQLLQQKLRRVKEEIAAMKTEWFNNNDNDERSHETDVRSSISDDLVKDLRAMKSEHERLFASITNNEQAQSERLQKLLTELEGYKLAAQSTQEHITKLEAKNSSLREEMQRKQFSSTAPLLPPPPHCDKQRHQEGYLRRHAAHASHVGVGTVTSTTRAPQDEDEFEHLELDPSSVRAEWSWLEKSMEERLLSRVAEEESEEVVQKLKAISEEAAQLEGELQQLLSRQSQGQSDLARHRREVDEKISAVKSDLSSAREREKQVRAQLQRVSAEVEAEEAEVLRIEGQLELDELAKKIKKSSSLLSRYKEHKTELDARAEKGVLKAEDASRIQDIHEELETLEAEKQLHELQTSTRHTKDPHSSSFASISALAMEIYSAASRSVEQRREGLCGALAYLILSLVEEKKSCKRATQEAQQQEMLLGDKNEEFEQLALVLHRTRTDLGQKLERQKKDYEDKISFLLRQLRGAELTAHSQSSLLRRSLEGQQQQGHERERESEERARKSVSSSVLSFVTSRPPSSCRPGAGGLRGERGDEGGEREELARRLEAERERREVLEKRNSELSRELRQFRRAAPHK